MSPDQGTLVYTGGHGGLLAFHRIMSVAGIF
jgi:hypothetical protein